MSDRRSDDGWEAVEEAMKMIGADEVEGQEEEQEEEQKESLKDLFDKHYTGSLVNEKWFRQMMADVDRRMESATDEAFAKRATEAALGKPRLGPYPRHAPPPKVTNNGRAPFYCRLLDPPNGREYITVDRLPVEMLVPPERIKWTEAQDSWEPLPIKHVLYDVLFMAGRPYIDKDGYYVLAPRR